MSETIIIDGVERGLGLLLPGPEQFALRAGWPALGDVVALWTDEQIREVLADPHYTPARQYMPPGEWVANQGRIGSCNGWAGAVGLETTIWKHLHKRVKLSGSYLYANINGNPSRDVGSMLDDGMKWLETNGVCLREQFPIEEYRGSQITQAMRDEARKWKGWECYRVSSAREMATAQAMGFILIVAVHVGNSFSRLDSNGVCGVDSGPGNHAVHTVDLRWRGRWEWDMRNSWGVGWGDKGHGWLHWGHFSQTVNVHQFYAIRATQAEFQLAG